MSPSLRFRLYAREDQFMITTTDVEGNCSWVVVSGVEFRSRLLGPLNVGVLAVPPERYGHSPFSLHVLKPDSAKKPCCAPQSAARRSRMRFRCLSRVGFASIFCCMQPVDGRGKFTSRKQQPQAFLAPTGTRLKIASFGPRL